MGCSLALETRTVKPDAREPTSRDNPTSTLAGVGVFYASFGILRLGVVLDVGLLIGAVGLLVAAASRARRSDPADVV